MPLNLAQTAISALKIGENNLTAIYNGIIRVYPNEVTVSIDGANASTQSGTPGQSMNNFIYVVTPGNASSYGWTAAQISAATLTGLPAGFTATFSASGNLGAQTGTWTINTTDGNFPSTGTAITVASLTSTISETGWGTINVNISGGSYWNNGSGSIVNFVGSTGSVGVSGSTITVIGVTIAVVGTGFSTSLTSGQAFTSSSQGGVGSSRMSATFNYTINSIGAVSSSVFVTSNNFPSTRTSAVTFEIPGPPWNVNPVNGIQAFTANYYTPGNPLYVDGRIQAKSEATWTGTSSGSVTFANGGIQQSRNPASYQNFSMRPGNGSFTITTLSNFGQPNGSNTFTVQNSVSWNWN